MTLSDLKLLSKIFSDSKHRAVSATVENLSFLLRQFVMSRATFIIY